MKQKLKSLDMHDDEEEVEKQPKQIIKKRLIKDVKNKTVNQKIIDGDFIELGKIFI